ncbi:MAG: hypothetical protein ACYC6W_03555 [Nitrosotalea sp.]
MTSKKVHMMIATVLTVLFVTSTFTPFASAQYTPGGGTSLEEQLKIARDKEQASQNSQTSNQTVIPVQTPQINGTVIPHWVKAVFGYYAQGNLSDEDLIKALQFLIQQGIIKLT